MTQRLNYFSLSMGWAALWAAMALAMNLCTLMNADNAWLLYAAGRMVGGEVPYVDFYETNPPLILWINAIPADLARLFAINPTTVFPFFIVALASGSLALVLHEIRRHPLLSEPRTGAIVFAALAQMLLGCSFLIFGQREHIFMLLALPYVVQSSSLAREPAWNIRQLIIAVMAGMAFSIKPYFVLIWLAGEVFSAISVRTPMLLLRRTNGVIALVGLFYAGSVLCFAPHYIHDIMPYILLTYSAFTAGGSGVAFPLMFLSLMYVLPSLFVKRSGEQCRFARKLFCWFGATVAVAALQHKGWLNHYFPTMVMGTFLLSSLLAVELRSQDVPMGRARFALLWALGFITFALPVVHLFSTRTVEAYQRDYIRQLAPYVSASHGEGKPLYVMSFELGAAFPMVNTLPVTFPFHFHNLWMLPKLILDGNQVNSFPLTERAKIFMLTAVGKDLEAFTPPLVVVDTNNGMAPPFKAFDFLAYFGQNAAFRAQWQHYREAGTITVLGKDAARADGHYTVYQRISGEPL